MWIVRKRRRKRVFYLEKKKVYQKKKGLPVYKEDSWGEVKIVSGDRKNLPNYNKPEEFKRTFRKSSEG
jgi:hypothetical protein